MQVENNRYSIQQVDLLALCQEVGTPLYVYDADVFTRQIHRLQAAFAGMPLRIKYAAKALTNVSVLNFFKKAGTGLDVVSLPEARLGLLAGFAPEEIMYTPNCVSFGEIRQAVELGVRMNLDNLPVLAQFGKTYGNSVPCCIRINPHIVAGGNAKIQVGHQYSKFGISVAQMEEVVQTVRRHQIQVNGLHIHTGSDLKDAQVFLQTARILFDAAQHFPDLQFINFGGGFKVAYREDDAETDVAALGNALREPFRAFCRKYGRELEIWFEPGKFLVSEAGYLLVRTNVVKQTPAVTFVGVDSGLNHLIRPMMYDAYHNIVNISNPGGKQRTYNVVGYICETDTFGTDRQLNEVREGDVLAIKNAGAYGFSMSSQYNSRLRPAEVMIYQGKPHLIRKREEMEDLLRNQVVVEWK